MKNIILGVVGGFLVLYTVVLGLGIYGTYSRRNELENSMGQVVKQTLESYYVPELFRDGTEQYPNKSQIEEEVQEKLRMRIDSDTDIAVSVLAWDIKKGLLSVKAEAVYPKPGGTAGHIECKKTVIIERAADQVGNCEIEFWVQGVLYKSYTKVAGEAYPSPKPPEGNFRGWRPVKGESQGSFASGKKVEVSEKWIADMGE